MKLLQIIFIAFVIQSVTANTDAKEPQKSFSEWREPSLVETEEKFLPEPATIGYVPDGVPFDNPSSALTKRTPTIPSAPDCTIRPQTVVEIKRMRHAAARIAQMIQTEVTIMEKRKTYVEQMTSYLNDRIRELNKVKGELEQENRWIEISNQRISELAQKEKLIKMQDVMSCLSGEQQRLQGAKTSQSRQLLDLQRQTNSLKTNIDNIKKTIDAVSIGRPAPVPMPVQAGVGANGLAAGGAAPVAAPAA